MLVGSEVGELLWSVGVLSGVVAVEVTTPASFVFERRGRFAGTRRHEHTGHIKRSTSLGCGPPKDESSISQS